MDALTFFGLRRVEAPLRWQMEIVPSLCSGMRSLFGGVGLGALVETLEQEAGRPAVWAAAQYLSHASPPSILDIEVTLAVEGRTVTQARAVGTVGDREIVTVNAAFGRRDFHTTGQWAVMPVVPGPSECPPRQLLPHHANTVMDRLDARIADARNPDDLPGPPGSGRSALWVKVRDLEMCSANLSVLGDYVPFGIGQALGERAGGGSIDNTIRIAQLAPTEWVLADIRIHAVHHGFAHGLVHLWTESGTLLATASQSSMVRRWRDEPEREQRS